jgi:nitroimidazol reductase NimA-like FMN-containing flavoprotein (pyridoxamine 5'-phosphate oxidase superfamily)
VLWDFAKVSATATITTVDGDRKRRQKRNRTEYTHSLYSGQRTVYEESGGQEMRRTDREVTDFNKIADVFCRANTIRLGLHDEPYPYIVPLSFGMEVVDGKIAVYFHGAKEGLKHDLIAANPNACVEADVFHGYKEIPKSVTTEYESVIGFGKCELVTDQEAAHGLDLLFTHCGFDGFEYDHKVLSVTAVYKVTLESVTGKRRFVKQEDK